MDLNEERYANETAGQLFLECYRGLSLLHKKGLVFIEMEAVHP